jgi:sirohydrochlorin ferrochelatase
LSPPADFDCPSRSLVLPGNDLTEEDRVSTAVLLISHGSRRREANDDLLRLAEIIRAKGSYAIVEPAYLELAAPDIAAAGAKCVSQGAASVKLLPYFLSAGAHVVEDLERHRRELAERFPHVAFELCPPLGLHPLMIEIVLDRLAQAGGRKDQSSSSATPPAPPC